jgi:hypothetical protein
VIAFARYAITIVRARIDLGGAHLCKRAHVTRTVSQRAYRRWDEDENKTVPMPVRCRCGRPAHPIHVRGAR